MSTYIVEYIDFTWRINIATANLLPDLSTFQMCSLILSFMIADCVISYEGWFLVIFLLTSLCQFQSWSAVCFLILFIKSWADSFLNRNQEDLRRLTKAIRISATGFDCNNLLRNLTGPTFSFKISFQISIRSCLMQVNSTEDSSLSCVASESSFTSSSISTDSSTLHGHDNVVQKP